MKVVSSCKDRSAFEEEAEYKRKMLAYRFITDINYRYFLAWDNGIQYIVYRNGNKIALPWFEKYTYDTFIWWLLIRCTDRIQDDETKYFLVDKRWVCRSSFFEDIVFAWEKYFLATHKDKQFYVSLLTWKQISEDYDEAGIFNHGLAKVKKDGEEFIINKYLRRMFSNVKDLKHIYHEFFCMLYDDGWFLCTETRSRVLWPFPCPVILKF